MTPNSIACQTCKIRRVKCDGATPKCQRCIKSRRECVDANALKQASFQIHSENSFASGKKKRPRGPRSSLNVIRPQTDLATQALSYYLADHLHLLEGVPNVSQSLPQCVSSWRNSGRDCGMVDLALSSLALTIFSRVHNHPPAAIEARARYHQLLKVARTKISALDQQNMESCLLAVYLMGRYESVRHCAFGDSTRTHFSFKHSCFHIDGAMAILKVWESGVPRTAPTSIIKHTRRELIRFFMFRGISLPEWILDGEVFGEENINLEFDRIIVRVALLQYAAVDMRKTGHVNSSDITELSYKAVRLDEEIQGWASRSPSGCEYQEHTLSSQGPWPKQHFYSSRVAIFPMLGSAAVWCQYFGMRLLLLNARIQLLLLVEPLLGNQLSRKWVHMIHLNLLGEIKVVADYLASTIPYCLGRLKVIEAKDDANGRLSIFPQTNVAIRPFLCPLVIGPLSIASSIQWIDVKQRAWFRSELVVLARVTGIGVVNAVNDDQWQTL